VTDVSGTRRYESRLREEQAAATRARIIEVAAEQFAPWATELPFERVAEAVPVSVRTVYRHFPTQRDLMVAVGHYFEENSGWNADEVTSDNIGERTRQMLAWVGSRFEAPDPPRTDDLDDGMREMRARRLTAIERSIGPLTEGLDPELARGVMAVFSGLTRLPFLQGMHDHWGLDGEQAGRAVEWAMNALLRDLRQGGSHGNDGTGPRNGSTDHGPRGAGAPGGPGEG
jgi:AcrR family transcriptional regulator